MRRLLQTFGLALVCASAVLAGGQKSQTKTAPPKVAFAKVKPILKACVGCHKPPKPAHGLDLTSYASLMKGDKKGKVVVPGQPSKSRLATVLHGHPQLMPPGGELDKSEIRTIESWIKSGAK